ncbi:component of anaerobic dehydrogenase [Haemophilus influenzae]|uniref:Component of anaerobic dehydrogenase n=1 Tax=Haemophilus influenzae TaxID=727 RepID=A0A2X1RM78_HAEIF|nr:component of anaerobic dehydrogenase [Haemophilus influenzae]
MPEVESADHFALLLLTASWLEDNSDSLVAQQEFFETFLLPCAAKFLTQVENQATLPFIVHWPFLHEKYWQRWRDELEEE